MSGAILVFPHMPSWLAGGHLHFLIAYYLACFRETEIEREAYFNDSVTCIDYVASALDELNITMELCWKYMDRGTEILRENPSVCQFLHHKFYLDLPANELWFSSCSRYSHHCTNTTE